MVQKTFHIKPLLEILFKMLKKSTNYFADAYLLKDVSLVSKWKTGKVIPKNEDLNKIVEFVNNESTGMQRHLIRINVEEYINESLLDISLKNMLLGIEDFSMFLTETLVISVSDMDANLNINISKCDIPSNSEDNELNENVTELKATKIIDTPSPSHEVQEISNTFAKLFHKFRTKLILVLIVLLFITIFIFQQFVSNNDMSSILYTSNSSLSNAPRTIELSEEYSVSYTYLKNSENEVQVDINGITLEYNNKYPKVIGKVLYLPIGQTIKSLGFSYISYNGINLTFKDMRTGKTVIATVNSKKLQIDDKYIKLSDKIITDEIDVYIPADSLREFVPYLERMIPQSIDINVDNEIQPKYQVAPRIVNGTLYLPFRYIFELFDYNVKPDRTIQDGIDRAIAKNDKQTVRVEVSKDYVVLNDDKPLIPLSSAVLMLADFTYVPVDIIEHVLNMDYNWDRDKKTLEISTGKSKK